MVTQSHLQDAAFLWLTGAMGALASLESLVPGYAMQAGETSMPSVRSDSKDAIHIVIRRMPFKVGERVGTAVSMNGSVPGPLLRMREGETVTIRVTNRHRPIPRDHRETRQGLHRFRQMLVALRNRVQKDEQMQRSCRAANVPGNDGHA